MRQERKYTNQGEFRYGEDKSPPLAWTGVPDGTVSLAIIMDDPDETKEKADVLVPWVHWVMWNIPPHLAELAEAVPTTTQVVSVGPNTRQGTNDYDLVGYSGPCPPPLLTSERLQRQKSYSVTDKKFLAHGYVFRIYALDTELELEAGASKNDLLRAIDGHILAAGEVKGEYINKKTFKGGT